MSTIEPTSLPSADTEHVMVSFGDIHLTKHWLVTPQGTRELAGTQVFVADFTTQTRVIPGWAIVLAVLGFFFFLLGLFFLLVRETRTTGFLQVTVSNDGFTYQSAIPAQGDKTAQLFELQSRANYARGLISRA